MYLKKTNKIAYALNTIYLLARKRETDTTYVLTILIRQITRELTQLTTNTLKLVGSGKPSTLREKSQRAHKSCAGTGGRGQEAGSREWQWEWEERKERNGNYFRLAALGTFCHVNAMFSMLLLSMLFSSSSSSTSTACCLVAFAGIL